VKLLEGVKVLELGALITAPLCGMMLADLGADVIKIERPKGGDLARALYLADQGFAGDSALFHTINRNKKSFAADLKSPRDLKRVKGLIQRADVMVHNFRPGVMDRLGLGYETVTALNPRLVYAAITGYGSKGPWRDKPGQDLLVQAMSGLSWLSGDATQGPVPVGISIADLTAGMHLCQGILAALVRRGTTGRGGRVDVSLFESALDLQFEQFTAFLNAERTQPARDETNSASLYLGAPYGVYETADGYLAIAMTPIKSLGELIGCAALTPYDDPSVWFRERARIKAVLAEHLVKQPTAHWLAILEPADVWCAEVFTWPQLLEQEGFLALGLTQEIQDNGHGGMLTTRCPIRIDGQVLLSGRGAPALGRDTDEIVRAFDLDSAEDR
jgi:crotonobetainyl-CoA:carnitine CoA-transferase CaiB-like acyl-CoA transferase